MVEDGDEFKMPEIAKAAVAEFENNVDFCRQFVRDNLYPVAYDLVQSTVAMTRGPGFKRIGDVLINERGMTQRKQGLRSRWATWLEHANGRTVRLALMTKVDLLAAARERRGRANEEITRAEFLEGIAAQLDDGDMVGDKYSTDDLEVLWATLNGGVAPETDQTPDLP